MRRVDMVLTPGFGTRFTNRLDRETDRVWRAAHREGRSLTRAQAAADAFERIVDGVARDGRGHADIVYAVDLPAWIRGELAEGELCHVVGGGPVTLSEVSRQVADAFIKVVVHDGTKVETVVHFGRRRPAVLQTVLDLGPPPDFDGVECSTEGCGRRFGVQWDHVDPVANGGATSKANLAPLCPPCHWEKTERDRAAGLLGPPRTRPERAPP
jgi:5-methylcytosine-specific restriction endonuclease McrA